MRKYRCFNVVSYMDMYFNIWQLHITNNLSFKNAFVLNSGTIVEHNDFNHTKILMKQYEFVKHFLYNMTIASGEGDTTVFYFSLFTDIRIAPSTS
jgi:hypothetical protein